MSVPYLLQIELTFGHDHKIERQTEPYEQTGYIVVHLLLNDIPFEDHKNVQIAAVMRLMTGNKSEYYDIFGSKVDMIRSITSFTFE